MVKKESQYDYTKKECKEIGEVNLGVCTSGEFRRDPKHLLFKLARYKFVAKMFDGFDTVLEVGCGDGIGAWLVQEGVGNLIAIDFDDELIKSAERRQDKYCHVGYLQSVDLSNITTGLYQGVFALDVLEHIRKDDEKEFILNMKNALASNGVLIIGSPSLESQPYASKPSREGHVNCKTGQELKSLFLEHFDNVFLFGMNDEVLHTGYNKMCHYNLVVCTGKREG